MNIDKAEFNVLSTNDYFNLLAFRRISIALIITRAFKTILNIVWIIYLLNKVIQKILIHTLV